MNLAKVLKNLYPEVAYGHRADEDGTWTLQDADYNNIECDSAAIDAAILADEQATQYQEDRRFAYPSIGDQLDALFHAGVFPDDMAAQIQAVKDANPKP